MGSNVKLKQIDIKNCTCYYFNDMIKIQNFHFDKILIGEKYKNILVNKISYKILVAAKVL